MSSSRICPLNILLYYPESFQSICHLPFVGLLLHNKTYSRPLIFPQVVTTNIHMEGLGRLCVLTLLLCSGPAAAAPVFSELVSIQFSHNGIGPWRDSTAEIWDTARDPATGLVESRTLPSDTTEIDRTTGVSFWVWTFGGHKYRALESAALPRFVVVEDARADLDFEHSQFWDARAQTWVANSDPDRITHGRLRLRLLEENAGEPWAAKRPVFNPRSRATNDFARTVWYTWSPFGGHWFRCRFRDVGVAVLRKEGANELAVAANQAVVGTLKRLEHRDQHAVAKIFDNLAERGGEGRAGFLPEHKALYIALMVDALRRWARGQVVSMEDLWDHSE